MKKFFILLVIIGFLFGCAKKEEKPVIKPSIEVIKANAEYDEKIKLYDLIKISNGKLITQNNDINTDNLGIQKIMVKYKDSNNKTYQQEFNLEVKDTTPPLLLNRTSYTIKVGTTNLDLVSKMICGDNYDDSLVCTVEGSYDVNTTGEYHLSFLATDSSGNKTNSPFTLYVKENPDYSTTPRDDINISTLINNYKTDKTEIGIDVSEWQGDIDFEEVKKAGVSFVMIRIGHGSNDDGTYYEDKCFKQNLENAKKAGLKVGIYYYSKAINPEEAIKQAKWIVNLLNKEKLDLPIAFDWESWSKFNDFHISYVTLNKTAESFMKEVIKNGYIGMLYGSASYLEKIWNLSNYPTWLAHYTDKTDYSKPYYIWQLANTGIVPGINSHVDLDVLYNK
jgi:lysozyme